MTLTANREVDHYIDQQLRTYQIVAAKHIYKGGLVGLSSAGYAQPLVAGDKFVGIAYEEIDNTTGANGALSVRVYTVGDFGHALAGATIAHVGRPVFASADDTLTFTANANSYVGVVQDLTAAGEIILRIDPSHRQIKTITHVVADLAAGADIAAQAIHSFEAEGWIVDARIVNQATASAGIDAANTCTVSLAIDAGNIVTEVFDDITAFPAANTAANLGAIANTHANAGDILTLAITNGATADPDSFVVEIDYV